MNRKQKTSNLLCIFSRYPQAGRCKTRLISELGAKGAAHLQQQMTEHVLRVGQQIGCDILLCVDGGRPCEIKSLFGAETDYVYQHGADLGERMLNGFHAGFSQKYQNVLLVGADCPSIEPCFLDEGFAALASHHDLVLGPTLDGGYYLIGMKKIFPEVFKDIAWGTEEVMAQTLTVARGLSVKMLPTLSDVDLPEDLHSLPSFLQVERA